MLNQIPQTATLPREAMPEKTQRTFHEPLDDRDIRYGMYSHSRRGLTFGGSLFFLFSLLFAMNEKTQRAYHQAVWRLFRFLTSIQLTQVGPTLHLGLRHDSPLGQVTTATLPRVGPEKTQCAYHRPLDDRDMHVAAFAVAASTTLHVRREIDDKRRGCSVGYECDRLVAEVYAMCPLSSTSCKVSLPFPLRQSNLYDQPRKFLLLTRLVASINWAYVTSNMYLDCVVTRRSAYKSP
ncbi:uncharacterized protein LACBIDRAFT_330499 [Laccaria bicolor S238N-H82]|uniref:Predicted protein n=1 Tax=Laccaria bicolor (strain S238N-H82 / ATCC MYA-4686) TaxID=486041 RepID=B0DLG8_LACBS|nr:uncharacterized protein LACBIDRAFT_330499 [Laccaria bicolor S238N-H82]EDR04645.1 predicted protein [Laccaria bicolor S238N-H82]|eukprot:XP_001884817.1 predicted protein [Laccaria bicolor S238N-H82]